MKTMLSDLDERFGEGDQLIKHLGLFIDKELPKIGITKKRTGIDNGVLDLTDF